MRIKDLREDRDLTQTELAAFLHIKQNTYSQYENGLRQLTSAPTTPWFTNFCEPHAEYRL